MYVRLGYGQFLALPPQYPKMLEKVVKDEVAKKLNEVRETYNSSYSKAIELLLKKAVVEDSTLLQINDKFEELKSLLPDLYSIIEIMRVIAIRSHKIDKSVEKRN